MKHQTLRLFLASTLLIAGLLTGCQKQIANTTSEAEETEQTVMVSEADAEAEIAFSDASSQAMGIDGDIGIGQIDLFAGANNVDPGEGNEGGDITTDPLPARCFTITISPMDLTTFPKTVTIDYGTGCTGKDGKFRKGKIITVYSKPLRVPGAEAVTEFSNYYVDSVKVEGRLSIKNNSTSSTLIITRTVQNGKLSKPNGNYIKWNAEHTDTQVAGLGTPFYPRDDEWSVSGGATGETMIGTKLINWSRQITAPLHKAFVCRWIDKGAVKITRNTRTASIDFGTGTCDNIATVTINGVSFEIKLR